ncbi:hypothetical protein IM538_21545 [Cytobacillus suaedae]|nr:hypothetical protein IM538_21545 [Cytobacillus suaedae]
MHHYSGRRVRLNNILGVDGTNQTIVLPYYVRPGAFLFNLGVTVEEQ